MINDNPKIGYLVPEFPTQTHVFFWREVSALRNLGAEVFLVSTKRPARRDCPHSFADQAHLETKYVFPPGYISAVVHLGLNPIKAFRCLKYVAELKSAGLSGIIKYCGLVLCAAILKQFCTEKGIQHIHVHSFADAAHLASLCFRLGGPTYSLTLHGDLDVYGKHHESKIRSASFLTAVTKQLEAQIRELPMAADLDVSVIWMGVDTSVFTPNPIKAHRNEAVHIVTIARLNANKGHRYALRAIKQLIDQGGKAKYSIVGSGPALEEIQAEIESLELLDHTNMVGSLEENEIIKLLRQTDIFVLPSVGHGEAAPVSIMEAMACGVPAISSIIGGTPDLITDQIDGFLFRQKDVESLSQILMDLYQNPELRIKVGINARETAVKKFDASIGATKLLKRIVCCTSNNL